MYKKKATKDKSSDDPEVKKNAGKELKVWVEQRDKAPAAPPSVFSAIVLKYDIENCDTTQGKKGVVFDIVQELEIITTGSKMHKGFRLSLMHQLQWEKFAQDSLVYPLEYAQELWQQRLASTDDDDKLWGGPKRSVQLWMQVEMYIDGSNHVRSIIDRVALVGFWINGAIGIGAYGPFADADGRTV